MDSSPFLYGMTMDETSEQGLDHSQLEQEEIPAEDFERLTALMDEQGDLPPHDSGVVEDPEQQADEQDAATKEAEPTGQPQLEEVEFEGKKYTIPPELKGALLRQADYTRKTQEVAQERAAAQQERQASVALMQQAQMFSGQIAQLQQIDGQLQQLSRVDWSQLQANDPIKSLEMRTAYGELLRARDNGVAQLQAARNHVANVQAQWDAHNMAKAVYEGNQVLSKDIPEWGQEKQQALAKTAVDAYGFRPEELQGLTDPRMVKVLHDAYRMRQLDARRGETSKRIQQAPPKPVRASAARSVDNPAPAAREIAQFKKTRSDDDATRAIAKLLG